MDSGDTLFPNTVADYLRDKEYRDVELLGKGGFGEVLSALSPKQEVVAIKIIDSKKIWHIEELIWPLLRHKNILPLLEMIDIPHLHVKLFVMPKMPYALDEMLYSKDFMTDKIGLKRVKRWLSDCQSGLKYLHMSGFAHLDLKKDNVLISADDQALLCDFSGLDLTGVPLRRFISPLEYRPPEYYNEFRYENLESSQCDIWLFGLMTLNILMKDWPARRMAKVTDSQSWKINVEPVLVEALKESRFNNIMKASFPSVAMSDEDITLAHDFVVSMMQWDNNKRPSVQEIENHPFLANAESPSVFIQERQNSKDVKCFVTNPFQKGWIDPEIACEDELVEEYQTDNYDQKDNLKNKAQYLEKSEAIFKCNFTNVVTNPFLDGWVGTEGINESTPDQEGEIEKDEQNVIKNSYSHQHFNKMQIADKCNNAFPIVCESKENNISKSPIDIYAFEKKLPKDKKKFGGPVKKWFVKKWHKVIRKKKNDYERLLDESEQHF